MRRLLGSRLLLIGVVGAYALLRLKALIAASPFLDYDSEQYARVASFPLWSAEFLAGGKPFVLPLLWKLLPGPATRLEPTIVYGDLRPVLIGALVISIACWITLAVVLARCVRHPGARAAAVTVVLGFSLSAGITRWDHTLLSESLSLSFTALLVAALLSLLRRPRPLALAAVLGAAFLWVFSRDTNALFLLLATPLVALALLRSRRGGLAVLLAGGAAALVALSLWTAEIGHRGDLPTRNALAIELLQRPQSKRFFVAHGMPWRPRLDFLLARRPISLYDTDPRLADFRRWYDEQGRRTWIEYLVRHPEISLWPPLRQLDGLYTPRPAELAVYREYKPLPHTLPGFLDAMAFPGSSAGLTILAALSLAGLAAVAAGRRLERVDAVPLALMASTLPAAVVIWNGDAVELDRHLYEVSVLARLGLLLVLVLAVDRGLAWARERTSRRAASALLAAVPEGQAG